TDGIDDRHRQAADGPVDELDEQLVPAEDVVDQPDEVGEPISARAGLGIRNRVALPRPVEGEVITAKVVSGRVAPIGVGEGRVARVGIQPQRADVTKGQGPEVYAGDERSLLARERPAYASHDPDIEGEGNEEGRDAVEEGGHGRTLARTRASVSSAVGMEVTM